MPEPTFNGAAIFGPAPSFSHDEPPNAQQINKYPGVIGVERLDLSPRESWTRVTGIFAGEYPEDLGPIFQQVRAIKRAGIIAPLVDTDNHTWSDAILFAFRTVGRSEYAPGWGWTREYEMTFLHLGTST